MADSIKDLKTEEQRTTIVLEPKSSGAVEVTGDTDEKEDHGGAWVGGAVLILIGSIFLLMNLTDFQLNNWWALFILIPAVSSLGNAVRVYRRDERLGDEGRGSLIGGLIMLFITSAFLFSWNWGDIWPFFLIIGGAGLLLNVFLD
jgi:hypothetical protein